LLDREDRRSQLRTFKEGMQWLKSGVPIMAFPEGKRSPDGRLTTFKGGIFSMAVKAQVPIIPLTICNTHAVMPSFSLFPIQQGAGKLHVHVHNAIETQGKTESELADLVREAFLAHLPYDQLPLDLVPQIETTVSTTSAIASGVEVPLRIVDISHDNQGLHHHHHHETGGVHVNGHALHQLDHNVLHHVSATTTSHHQPEHVAHVSHVHHSNDISTHGLISHSLPSSNASVQHHDDSHHHHHAAPFFAMYTSAATTTHESPAIAISTTAATTTHSTTNTKHSASNPKETVGGM
jgi:hypothetical protein